MRWLPFWVFIGIISFYIDELVLKGVTSLQNPVLNSIFLFITNIYVVIFLLLIFASIVLYEEKKYEWIPVLVLSFLFSFFLSYLIKFLVQRQRPDISPILFENSYSFVSAHSAVAFSTIYVLNREFPRIKYFWITSVVLIAFSRIFVGVHFLTDVIFGALLGYYVGKAIFNIETKTNYFKKQLNKIKWLR